MPASPSDTATWVEVSSEVAKRGGVLPVWLLARHATSTKSREALPVQVLTPWPPVKPWPPEWQVPKSYVRAKARFVTARASLSNVLTPNIVALRIPPGSQVGNETLFHLPVNLRDFPLFKPQLLPMRTLTRHRSSDRPRAGGPSKRALPSAVVLGVIDGPTRFVEKNVVDRVKAIWHMGAADELDADEWQPNTDFGYGSIAGPKPISEMALPEYSVASTHGSLVMNLAAGALDPVNPQAESTTLPDVVLVHLPTTALHQTHGAWLNVYLLDGIRFILDNAQPDAPVVVNISLGSYAGPHDGGSLLEQALDDLIAQEGGRLTIVMAAGNAQEARLHARFNWPEADLPRAELFDQSLHLQSDLPRTTVVEGWCRGSVKFSLSVVDNVGRVSAAVSIGPGQAFSLGDSQQRCVGMASMGESDGGDLSLLVLLAHTDTSDDADPQGAAPSGRWTLRIEPTEGDAGHADLWVWRREDLESGRGQAQFEAVGGHLSKEMLMAGCCFGRLPIVVGALEVDDHGGARLANYSAGGPSRDGLTRLTGPDLCTQGHVDGSRGTSYASPIVARRVCEIYARERRSIDRSEMLDLLAEYPQFDRGLLEAEDHSRAGVFWLAPTRL